MQLTHDQQIAYDLVADWAADTYGDEQFFCLGGAAGTGKTTLLGKLVPVLEDCAEVIWAATTGKAAQRLIEVARVPARTLHAHLYSPPDVRADELVFNDLQAAPGADTIVVVEEASMISPSVYEDMQTWAEAGTRFLLVGDPYQLPPVISTNEEKKYGKDFTVFMEHPGHVLTQVMRSNDGIIEVASEIRYEGRLPTQSTDAYKFRSALHIREATDDWLAQPHDHALITWRNALRMKMNNAIRHQHGHRGLPAKGELVLFCKNGSNVINGMIGTLRVRQDGPVLDGIRTHDVLTEYGWTRTTCCGRNEPMDGSAPLIRDWDAYKAAILDVMRQERKNDKRARPKWPVPLTWGYALTAHKAQGSEWDRVTIGLTPRDTDNKFFSAPTLLPNGGTMPFALRWIYTAVTRARTRATVIIGPE